MNKVVLLSANAKELKNILNGKATMLVRKKVPFGYVGWVYLYCNKGKSLFVKTNNEKYEVWSKETFVKLNDGGSFEFLSFTELNEKVVARFWYDSAILIEVDSEQYRALEKETCWTIDDFTNYCNGEDLYGLKIKDLKIFDEPKELKEFYKYAKRWIYSTDGYMHTPYQDEIKVQLSTAPKTFMYIYTYN